MITEDIANQVRDLLGIPVRKYARRGPAYLAVQKVFETIILALQRGEEVQIEGFGIFRVITKPPRGREVAYPYPLGTPPTSSSPRVYEVKPAHKIVKFFPSKVLIRYINQ